MKKDQDYYIFPRYHHFDRCKVCSHRRGVHVDGVVDVADVGSKHPPDKKSDPVKKHSSLYILRIYTAI